MFLGIDYGQKRVGLALAEDKGPAVPWQILEYTNDDNLIEQLQEIILENNITGIVVGWPLSLAGKVTERTEATDKFVKRLQAETDVEVIMEDERMTSSIVTKATGLRQGIDAKSATEILQTYLDRTNVGS